MDITGLGSAVSGVASLAKTVADKFFPDAMSDGDKAKAELELQTLLQNYETTVVNAKSQIVVAEMKQKDNYTKRARPTVVYAGLAFIGLVHVLFPILSYLSGETPPELALPTQFWYTWGGVVSVWMIGRTQEKMGNGENKVVKMITG